MALWKIFSTHNNIYLLFQFRVSIEVSSYSRLLAVVELPQNCDETSFDKIKFTTTKVQVFTQVLTHFLKLIESNLRASKSKIKLNRNLEFGVNPVLRGNRISRVPYISNTLCHFRLHFYSTTFGSVSWAG